MPETATPPLPKPADFTLLVLPGSADAALYLHQDLVSAGYAEEVLDVLLDRLGVRTQTLDFITDKTARGWDGVAKTLDEAYAAN